MLDYRAIEALCTVLELQSFEAAAKKLFITQSAVSQRIKTLENHYSEPLLIRVQPYRPTDLGASLIAHFKKVSLLEESLEQQLENTQQKAKVAIALNRDSLETWFLDLIEETPLFEEILLEIIADDQELTLSYLQRGLASACLSTTNKETLGAYVTPLGTMEYLLVASPKFVKKYFSQGDSKKHLLRAPALKFDANDNLHEKYLEKYFRFKKEEQQYQIIPSVKGFKKYALLGYGYGLIPKIDIINELKNKELIHLHKNKTWKIPLFWHHWAIDSPAYQQFNQKLIKSVARKLQLTHSLDR